MIDFLPWPRHSRKMDTRPLVLWRTFNYSMRSKGLAQGFNEYNDILWSFEDMLRLTTIGFYLSTYIRMSEDFGGII